jgi:hypothetical protein
VETVRYKGFLNCDNKARKPNAATIEGIHEVFTTKKLMKKAQTENPLAGTCV